MFLLLFAFRENVLSLFYFRLFSCPANALFASRVNKLLLFALNEIEAEKLY